jgi:hypothetical protein
MKNTIAIIIATLLVAGLTGCTWTTYKKPRTTPVTDSKNELAGRFGCILEAEIKVCGEIKKVDANGITLSFDKETKVVTFKQLGAGSAAFIIGDPKSLGTKVATRRVKKMQFTVRFIPVQLGPDAYGIRLMNLPAGHPLLKRGYVEGEILASFNGEAFGPDKEELLKRVISGQLEDVHLTVIRDGREVSLEPGKSS